VRGDEVKRERVHVLCVFEKCDRDLSGKELFFVGVMCVFSSGSIFIAFNLYLRRRPRRHTIFETFSFNLVVSMTDFVDSLFSLSLSLYMSRLS